MNKEQRNRHQQRYERYSNHIAYLEGLQREWRMKHRMGEPIVVEYHILRRLLQEAILRTRGLQKTLQNSLINSDNEKNENK